MSCGIWCVYYKNKGSTSACMNCSDNKRFLKPRFEMGKVDIFKLAQLLKEKEERSKKEHRKDA